LFNQAIGRFGSIADRKQRGGIRGDKEPPPLPALPEPLDDRAEILAAIRSELDIHSVYERGNRSELRLLMSQEQERELARHELAQAMQCAATLLPPREEDRGERACLRPGAIAWADVRRLPVDSLFRRIAAARSSAQAQPKLLPDAVAALLRARARRRQTTLARAAAAGLPLPVEPELRVPLTGRYAAYWTSDLEQLCAGLDSAGLLRLKQVLVEQALWYAIQILPGPVADHGHLATLEAVEQWLSQPSTDAPSDTMGRPPAAATSSDAMVWKAVRGVAEAARAPNAQSLLQALGTVVAHATAVKTQTAPSSAVAVTAVTRSRDYQLAAAYQIGGGFASPIWLGPQIVYSPDSLDAVLQRMSETQHGQLRWGLVSDGCSVVRRGLEALAQSSAWMPGGWQLVTALQDWAASPEAKTQGAELIPTPSVEAARRAASAESGQMSGQLALALQTAAQPPALPERLPFVTRAVAEYSEHAIGLAGHAIAERWQLDAAYALLLGAEPPPLSVLTSL
jgi:hypothetical protein